MSDRPGLIRTLASRGLDRIEEAVGGPIEVAGKSLIDTERVEVLEAAYEDYRLVQRDLEDIGYRILDYVGGRPSEMTIQHRRKVVQRARYVWMNDPQAGAAVELLTDFTLGRGIPKPRAKDAAVQDVIDEAWNDADNAEVLTSLEAQVAFVTDLALQSNVFYLMFDEGADGKVKLSILRHDTVVDAVQHPEKRHRVLYFVAFEEVLEWDFATDGLKPARVAAVRKPVYYEHWKNVEETKDDELDSVEVDGVTVPIPVAPPDRVKPGVVYHVRINRHSEQVFGVPRFQRTLRWYSAYNSFVKSRIDMAQAAAQFIMKRRLVGTPGQLARDATKLINKNSMLAGDPAGTQQPGRNAQILSENDSVQHEPLVLDTKAGNASQDASMIRAPISASERWPQSFFGDAHDSNLATATSLELPVLKRVESMQQVVEDTFRWFIDRVIEKGVEAGKISKELTSEELAKRDEKNTTTQIEDEMVAGQSNVVLAALHEAVSVEEANGHEVLEMHEVEHRGETVYVLVARDREARTHLTLVQPQEAHEDKAKDEKDTHRDLGYEFQLPSPLRRMMGDLVTAIQQIATAFDPNNTNIELSRVLLTIALGQALEVDDPADLVEKILPPGYVDPAIAAAQAAQQQPASGFGPDAAGQPLPPGAAPSPDAAGNAYGAPMTSTLPEDMRSNGKNGAYQAQQAAITVGRDGRDVVWPLVEHGHDAGLAKEQANGREREVTDSWDSDVVGASIDALQQAERETVLGD